MKQSICTAEGYINCFINYIDWLQNLFITFKYEIAITHPHSDYDMSRFTTNRYQLSFPTSFTINDASMLNLSGIYLEMRLNLIYL